MRTLFSLFCFPAAGLCSAWIAVRFQQRLFGFENLFGGVVFGALLLVCIWLLFGFTPIWKSLAFVIISAATAYLSFFSALLTWGVLKNFPPYLPNIFVGGTVGAFLLLSAASLLFVPFLKWSRSLSSSLYWAWVGGVLAVLGQVCGRRFHNLTLRLDPHQVDWDVSLIFIWQTGTASVLGLMLWFQNRYSHSAVVHG